MTMKKQALILTSLLVVMGALLTTLLLLLRNPPPVEEGPALSMLGSFEVMRFEAPIVEVAVSPPDGSQAYTVKALPSAGGDASASSTLAGDEDLPINAAKTNGVLASAQRLEATRLLHESTDDYALYGLAAPQATVRITDESGLSQVLLIGSHAPDRSNHYVQVQGDAAVYLVPDYRINNYLQPETSYIDTTVTSGGAADFYDARRFVLGGAAREEFGDIVVTPMSEAERGEKNLHTHLLRAPVSLPLHYQYGLNTMMGLFGLKATSVAAIRPDEGQLAGYGLDEPYATVSVAAAGSGGFALSASKPDAYGQVYLMREGLPIVFVMDESALPWLDMQFYDLMNRAVSPLYLDAVAEISISAPDRIYTFTLDHSDSARLEIYIDGRLADRNSFMTLCETLRGARYEEYTLDLLPADAAPYLAVTYRYLSPDTPDKAISFYPGPPRKFFVDAGDMDFYFYTGSLYVDKVLAETAAAAAVAG